MKYIIILLTSLFLVSNASAEDANKISALEIIENGRYVGDKNKTDEYIIFAKWIIYNKKLYDCVIDVSSMLQSSRPYNAYCYARNDVQDEVYELRND